MLVKLFINPNLGSRGRLFHVTASLLQSKEEQFRVNNDILSYTAVQAVPAESRTIAHWQVLLDWELQRTRPYVIVDPFDPNGLLYLSTQEYIVQSRTLGSMNAPFIVVARPGSKKPDPITKIPPNLRSERTWVGIDFDPVTWRKMRDLRSFIARNVSWGQGDTVKVNDGNIMGLVFVWTRELLHYLHVKKPAAAQDQFFGFGKHLQAILVANGPDFLIKRLKILLFALYSFVGGNPLKTTEPLGQRIKLSNGLPTVFPRALRESIRTGSLMRIRVWASLLNIYKYLKGTHGATPLDTIEAPPFEGDIASFHDFCTAYNGFFRCLVAEIGVLPPFQYQSASGKAIVSAGANTSCSLTSIPFDAIAWSETFNLPLQWFWLNGDRKLAGFMEKVMQEAKQQWKLIGVGSKSGRFHLPKDQDKLRVFLRKLKSLFPVKGDLKRLEQVVDGSWSSFADGLSAEDLRAMRELIAPWNRDKDLTPDDDHTFAVNLWLLARRGLWTEKIAFSKPVTGRLIAIPEPAGKVRVVAACDYFTQVALYPLHEYLFSILRLIPTDATFDQEGAVKAFSEKGYTNIYSYDLKSATDLIPWQLYEPLMTILVGEQRAKAWLALLRDRDFYLKPSKKDLAEIKDCPPEIKVRYSRGQPMGAYSSWALLALVHHALVQYAARLAGHTAWFRDYLVLGDDIVIASDEVGQKYLDICERYGITVGLPKSLISKKGMMNFASQTLIKDVNISPISFKEELNSNSWDRRLEFANRIDRRWGDKRGDQVASLRRILSYAQWQALQGELQGKEWKYTLGFILFILQQPFRGNDCHIGKIVSWLGLLSPELKTLPGELVQELDLELRLSIWKALRQDYQTSVQNCIATQRVQYAKGSMLEQSGVTGYNTVWTYLGREVFKNHINDSIFERLMDLSPLFDKVESQWERRSPTTEWSEILPPIQDLIYMWDEYQRIPKVVLPKILETDFRQGIIDVLRSVVTQDLRKAKSILKQNPRWDIVPSWYLVKESLHAPLREISLAVARKLGVILPVYSLLHRYPPQNLRKALGLAVAEYRSSRITRDASPHMRDPDPPGSVQEEQGTQETIPLPEIVVNDVPE